MSKIIVCSWDAGNRVTAELRAGDAEAAAKLAAVQAEYPNAFITEHPGGDTRDLLVNPVNGTVSIDPVPVVKPTVVTYEAFQGRFTAAELDGATDFVYEISLVTGKPKRPKLLQAFNGSVARDKFDLLAPSMALWMDALVTATILTQERRDIILTP